MSFMAEPTHPRIICLSNIFDQHYHDLRGEKIDRGLSSIKRQVLFQCLEKASGREVIVLSSPPKAAERRAGKWLPPLETKFSTHRQFFCAGWDVPKLRVPLSWIFYACHVLRHTRSGDVVVIDNYEIIYVFAAWWLKLFWRVTFILDYEDGKHLIDRSIWKLLSGLAETAGRPLLSGAMLAHPALGRRLPSALLTELVPGFIPEIIPPYHDRTGPDVRFLYSGTLDGPRGVDLLLEAVKLLPAQGWHLDITGHGPLADTISRFVSDARWQGKVEYHHSLPTDAYERLLAACHAGLNCQRTSDPISGVTFPSKVFTYLSAGLVVISSRASEVDTICGKACLYYDEETPQSLAAAMIEAITDFAGVCQKLDRTEVTRRFSVEATAARLQKFCNRLG
jgi:glycosyltransferase involved in cell wall biosynthesis